MPAPHPPPLKHPPPPQRRVIILVQAGAPVDATIDKLCEYMEPGDIIIDGGNEWCVINGALTLLLLLLLGATGFMSPPVC